MWLSNGHRPASDGVPTTSDWCKLRRVFWEWGGGEGNCEGIGGFLESEKMGRRGLDVLGVGGLVELLWWATQAQEKVDNNQQQHSCRWVAICSSRDTRTIFQNLRKSRQFWCPLQIWVLWSNLGTLMQMKKNSTAFCQWMAICSRIFGQFGQSLRRSEHS